MHKKYNRTLVMIFFISRAIFRAEDTTLLNYSYDSLLPLWQKKKKIRSKFAHKVVRTWYI